MCFWKKKKKPVEKVAEKPTEKPVEKVAEKPAEKPVEKVAEKPAIKEEKKEVAKGKNDDTKKDSFKYHISQNKDDKSEFFKQWRVRKSGSDKTIKYFKTQKEAIDYAKQLADNNDASIVIHKEDGSIRKQNYSK